MRNTRDDDATATGGDVFFLFHRPRRCNAVEGRWMGYERKRGKLADLNALLRGGAADRFARIVGDMGALAGVRYVITLDTDTELPRDAARQLVGRDGASPQSSALHTPTAGARGLVAEGYGILQPRVSIGVPGANRSRYAAPARRRSRRGSVYPRGLRRVPGRVRRGLVHRQGHLRRRRVRARPVRPLSREPDPLATICWRVATPGRDS